MKRLYILMPLIFIFSCGQQSEMASVSGKISSPADYTAEEYYVGLYAIRTGENLDEPTAFAISKDGSFNLETKPGKYVLAAWAKGLQNVRMRILVTQNGERSQADISLEKQKVPVEISSVKVVGEFCDWNPAKAVEMKNDNGKWTLTDTKMLIEKREYAFIVNDQKHPIYDAVVENVELNKNRTTFQNIYTTGAIEFNTADFMTTEDIGSIAVTGQWSDFNDFMDEMDEFTKLYRETRAKNKGASIEIATENYNILNKKLDEIDTKFSGKYAQLVLAARIARLTFMHPVLKEVEPAFAGGITDTTLLGNVIAGANFAEFRETTDGLLEQIDVKSQMLDGGFVRTIAAIDDYLAEAPTAVANAGLATNYYSKKLLAMEELTSNKDLGGTVLFSIGWILTYKQKVEEAEAILLKIKEKYPQHSSVTRGTVDRALASLKMTIGTVAPLFAVETITGDSLKLSDFRGKFVFIDFWGTWCGPCRREIPHIIEMAHHFSPEKLQVVGLTTYDTLEKVKNYVATNNIPYPNALGPEAVTKAYGITAFPTTFLIDLDGHILAKNLSGGDLTKKIEEQIAAWEMKKNMSGRG